MDPKSLFASKTFYFNLLSGLALFFGLDELKAVLGESAVPYLSLAVAGINIVLRYVTVQPVEV